MRYSIIIAAFAAFFLPFSSFASGQNNYTITIDGKSYDVSEGKTYSIALGNGKNISVRIDKKEISTWDDAYLTFKHGSNTGATVTDIGEGIQQIFMSSGVGTAIIIQEYPVMMSGQLAELNELMLSEITSEEVDLGYKMKRKNFSVTLGDGTVFKGFRATLTKGSEKFHYTTSSFGRSGKAIMVVTRIDQEAIATDQAIIDLLWESLKVKL